MYYQGYEYESHYNDGYYERYYPTEQEYRYAPKETAEKAKKVNSISTPLGDPKLHNFDMIFPSHRRTRVVLNSLR